MTQHTVDSAAEVVISLDEKRLIRILHVDDDSGLLKITRKCLEMEGPFQVYSASSAEEALTKVKQEPYDVIVSDYQMSGKDGLEFLKELRQKGDMIPFIMFTGRGSEEVAIQALNLGAARYLNKSASPETVYAELAHGIFQVVKARREERRLRYVLDNMLEGCQIIDKIVKEALQDSEEKFKTIVENSQDVIMLTKPDGIISYLNPVSSKVLGYKPQELVGKQPWIIHPDDLEDVKHIHYQAMKGKSGSKEYRIVTKTGETKWVYHSWSSLITKGQLQLIVSTVKDITERKKSEEALRKSEEELRESENKFRTIFEGATVGILAADPKTRRLILANPEICRLTGYCEKELLNRGMADIHPEKDFHHVIEQFKKATQGKTTFVENVPVLKNDKSLIYCDISSCNLRIGNQDLAIGFFRDVTERKKMEKSSRESEEKFRNLAEQSPNMIFINKRGRVVYANKKAEEVMGYKKEEFCSPDFDFLTLIAPESRELIKSVFTKHMDGKDPVPFEYRLVTRQGRIIDTILNSKLIDYEGERAILGTITEITEQKKNEKAVQESQKKFEGLFIGNPEAAAYLGPDLNIEDINPRFEELFGYSPAEVKGKHIDDVVVQKDMMDEAKTLNEKAMEGYVYHNTVRRRKDGTLIPVAVSAAPIKVGDRLAGYVAMYKDISDLKNAEKKLEEMNEKLRVVGGLTRHDVRNKLASVSGNVYLARKKLVQNDEAQGYLSEIESAVQQVTRIFDFAASYEKLGVEKLVYVDVGKTIEEAVSLFSDLHGVKVENNCQGLIVLADSLLRQLFYNLIDNSQKHGEKTTRITIRYENVGRGQLRLIYEDDGAGMSEDVKQKIFKEGYTTGKGSGYGLYLIQKMAEVYGWTIEATSEHRKGTRFTITIPKTNKNGKEVYRIL